MRIRSAGARPRVVYLTAWYSACLAAAVPWWMLFAPTWTLFALILMMTAVAFSPGGEPAHRRRGAFLWGVASILLIIGVAVIALAGVD